MPDEILDITDEQVEEAGRILGDRLREYRGVEKLEKVFRAMSEVTRRLAAYREDLTRLLQNRDRADKDAADAQTRLSGLSQELKSGLAKVEAEIAAKRTALDGEFASYKNTLLAEHEQLEAQSRTAKATAKATVEEQDKIVQEKRAWAKSETVMLDRDVQRLRDTLQDLKQEIENRRAELKSVKAIAAKIAAEGS